MGYYDWQPFKNHILGTEGRVAPWSKVSSALIRVAELPIKNCIHNKVFYCKGTHLLIKDTKSHRDAKTKP